MLMTAEPHQDSHLSDKLGTRSSFDLYAEVTRKITDMLDAGVVPWRSPILGRGGLKHPRNMNSGRKYRGINTFLLAFTAYAKGYDSAYWLTFKQASERGGKVKKGEKSSMVVFWKQYEVTDPQTQQPKKVFVLRYYNVFNVLQCQDIPQPDPPNFQPVAFNPIEQAEKIVKAYDDPPVLEHHGSQAFYRPTDDTIRMPDPTRFATNEEYYSTLFHEMSHSTGHSKRLDRKLDTDMKPFGTPDYGKEELIAEMSAAFLCAHAGIQPAVIQNQAAYISGWLGQLKQDKRLIIFAAGQGQRAADWILGTRHEDVEAPHTESVAAPDPGITPG